MKGLLEEEDTKWRVTKFDRWQNKHYGKLQKSV